METAIYYYTGTGNSLWTARTLALALGNTEIRSMAFSGVRKKRFSTVKRHQRTSVIINQI